MSVSVTRGTVPVVIYELPACVLRNRLFRVTKGVLSC
jgi:hypothetical protein